MFTKKTPVFLFVAILTAVQLACNFANSTATPDTFATLNELYTASALTLEADPTQPAVLLPTATPGLPLPTYSPGPPPTGFPVATATNRPVYDPPVPTSICDAAEFVKDMTYPDGTPVTRNTTFEKTWRIKNVGTCTWTTSYSLVFAGGYPMSGPAVSTLARSVSPGASIDITVKLTAPSEEGEYLGYWKLRNTNGVNFGIGDKAEKAFWVEIRVPGASYMAYSFVEHFCEADWRNEDVALPCPGKVSDPNGYVLRLDSLVMENGVTENNPSLLTVPQDVRHGEVSGEYPAFTIQAGDHFRTIVGCQYEAKKCDVVFRLDYKKNGTVKNLFHWNEVYEGNSYPIDFDLSSLAGDSVKLILVVTANGGQNQDYAIWLHPFILRQGTPGPTAAPTLTFTPTPTPTATPTSTPTP
ncbi:NBR1-Ig-like domain-containing protein [Candidatus Villigracilis affinis]|uniref:NBR1-Ig-like domain-containing protein n=1 Tax=Candidatus Villigracilis affinis TaxID=3140682 RepID=UPI001DF50ACD|nr:hypothetical protein [Anaerolineales bacterium]